MYTHEVDKREVILDMNVRYGSLFFYCLKWCLLLKGDTSGTGLDVNDLLFLSRLAFALLLFVFELAEIHDLAHGWRSVGRDFNKIQTDLHGHFHGALRRHDADIFTIRANQPNFGDTDLVVDARAGITGRRRVMRSAGYGFAPLIV